MAKILDASEVYYSILQAIGGRQAPNDSLLSAWDYDTFLTECKNVLHLSDEVELELKDKADKDPVVLTTRQGQMHPALAASRHMRESRIAQPPVLPAYPTEPPPQVLQRSKSKAASIQAPPAAYGAAFAPPFIPNPPALKPPAAKKAKKDAAQVLAAQPLPPPHIPLPAMPQPPVIVQGDALVGRKILRYSPDAAITWQPGTIQQYEPANNKYCVHFNDGRTKAYVDWVDLSILIHSGPNKMLKWAPEDPAPKTKPPPLAGATSKSKSGSSKSGASTPKAPAPKAPVIPPAAVVGPPYPAKTLQSALQRGVVREMFDMSNACAARFEHSLAQAVAHMPPGPTTEEVRRMMMQLANISRREHEVRRQLYAMV